jgi:hypothetical protein
MRKCPQTGLWLTLSDALEMQRLCGALISSGEAGSGV